MYRGLFLHLHASTAESVQASSRRRLLKLDDLMNYIITSELMRIRECIFQEKKKQEVTSDEASLIDQEHPCLN